MTTNSNAYCVCGHQAWEHRMSYDNTCGGADSISTVGGRVPCPCKAYRQFIEGIDGPTGYCIHANAIQVPHHILGKPVMWERCTNWKCGVMWREKDGRPPPKNLKDGDPRLVIADLPRPPTYEPPGPEHPRRDIIEIPAPVPDPDLHPWLQPKPEPIETPTNHILHKPKRMRRTFDIPTFPSSQYTTGEYAQGCRQVRPPGHGPNIDGHDPW